MGFLRKSSMIYDDHQFSSDAEPTPISRAQRRLSKPQTSNRSSLTSINSASKKSHRKSLGKETTVSPNRSNDEFQDLSKTQVLQSSDEERTVSLRPKASAVALMISRFESPTPNASTSQLSLITTSKPRRPKSGLLKRPSFAQCHKASVSTLASRDNHIVVDDSPVSPYESTEHVAFDPAPPARRSSFAPGAETRRASRTRSGARDSGDEEKKLSVVLSEPAESIFGKLDDESLPLPSSDRPDTPTDLDYTHLGGIGLGSLRVVNGRASPAFSEMSKHLNAFNNSPRARREVSSHYEGSIKGERWEDENLPTPQDDSEPVTPTADGNRSFSFARGLEERIETVRDDAASISASSSQDKTSQMAEDYIAELAVSPYSAKMLATKSTVIHHEDKMNSKRSFDEQTIDIDTSRDQSRSETAASFHTAEEPNEVVAASTEDFSTPAPAVYEHSTSAANELRPPRPPVMRLKTPQRIRPRLSEHSTNARSDSGYGSNTSTTTVTSLPTEFCDKTLAGVPYSDLEAAKPVTPTKESVFSKDFALPFRKPVAKSDKPAMTRPSHSNPAVESQATFDHVTVSPLTAVPATETLHALSKASTKGQGFSEKQMKPRKKLQKSRRKSIAAPQEIIVQSSSLHDFDIPAVPLTARENLAVRSSAMPELERTFPADQNVRHRPNASTLDLSSTTSTPADVRFPSPAPDDQRKRSSSRSRGRPAAQHRPRSWFGWTKRDKSQKRKSCMQEENSPATLESLGSVIDVLGSNPYDIANESFTPSPIDPYRRSMSPHKISSLPQKPTSIAGSQGSIGDLTYYRKQSSERLQADSRRQSFDDRQPRGRVRTSVIIHDAPPLPPMPDPEEIERRYSSRLNQAELPSRHTSPQLDGKTEFCHSPVSDHDEAVPPPPPPHSPMPQEVYDIPNYERAFFGDIAPPPPSHSPRPMDVIEYPFPESAPGELAFSPHNDEQEGDIWAAHSQAWRARRQTANATLRGTWDIYNYPDEKEVVQENVRETPYEELYPEIPHRPQRSQTWQEGTTEQYYEQDHYHHGHHEYFDDYQESGDIPFFGGRFYEQYQSPDGYRGTSHSRTSSRPASRRTTSRDMIASYSDRLDYINYTMDSDGYRSHTFDPDHMYKLQKYARSRSQSRGRPAYTSNDYDRSFHTRSGGTQSRSRGRPSSKSMTNMHSPQMVEYFHSPSLYSQQHGNSRPVSRQSAHSVHSIYAANPSPVVQATPHFGQFANNH